MRSFLRNFLLSIVSFEIGPNLSSVVAVRQAERWEDVSENKTVNRWKAVSHFYREVMSSQENSKKRDLLATSTDTTFTEP